jgi:hypothetical protein
MFNEVMVIQYLYSDEEQTMLQKESSSSPCNYWESRYHSLELKQIDPNTEEVSMNTAFPEVFELTVSEKLQLLEDLWGSIALNPEQIPVLD